MGIKVERDAGEEVHNKLHDSRKSEQMNRDQHFSLNNGVLIFLVLRVYTCFQGACACSIVCFAEQ